MFRDVLELQSQDKMQNKTNNFYLRSGSGVSKAVKSSIKVIAFTVASSPSIARSVWSSSYIDKEMEILEIFK